MARSFRLSIDADRDPLSPVFKYNLIIASAIVGVVGALYWFAATNASSLFSTDCQSLDKSASANVARLVADYSAMAEVRLTDAVFRLKRARSLCRNGWTTLARQDYDALIGGRYSQQQRPLESGRH